MATNKNPGDLQILRDIITQRESTLPEDSGVTSIPDSTGGALLAGLVETLYDLLPKSSGEGSLMMLGGVGGPGLKVLKGGKKALGKGWEANILRLRELNTAARGLGKVRTPHAAKRLESLAEEARPVYRTLREDIRRTDDRLRALGQQKPLGGPQRVGARDAAQVEVNRKTAALIRRRREQNDELNKLFELEPFLDTTEGL